MPRDIDPLQMYKSLPIPPASRCVRMLYIEAATDGQDEQGDPIKCHLEVAKLDNKPHFNALSYVWGPTGPFHLLCNGVHLPITTNCFQALWHLRKKLGAFWIWVDAVCIDQQNDREKAQQIPLMGDIYAGASEVYIWLGEGNVATDKAMSFLANGGLEAYCTGFSAYCHYLAYRWSSTRTMVPEPADPLSSQPRHMPINPSLEPLDSGKVIVFNDDLEKLLSCAWTTRIWTYQEVVLASRPVVVRGLSHVAWPQFACALTLLEIGTDSTSSSMGQWMQIIDSWIQHRDLTKDPLTELILGQFETFRDMVFWHKLLSRFLVGAAIFIPFSVCLWLILRLGPVAESVLSILVLASTPVMILVLFFIFWAVLIPPNPPLSWNKPLSQGRQRGRTNPHMNLLNNICWRSAREPRDMVYGTLPMLKGLDFRPSLSVDYNVSLAFLYTELALFFLTECNDQNILALAAQAKCPGASSWVPDFSKNLKFISSSLVLPPPERRDTAVHTPTQNSQAGLNHARSITVKANHYIEIHVVTNFVATYFTPDEQELRGRRHNASCMMRLLSCILHGERMQSLENDPYDPIQLGVAKARTYDENNVFQIYFQQAHIRMDAKTLKRYQNAIMQSLESNQTAAQLVKVLDASEMLWVHDSICNTFAGSECCYFVSVGQKGTWSYEEPRFDSSRARPPIISSWEHSGHQVEDINYHTISDTGRIRWIGYVKGIQQGKIQVGDKVIGLAGVEDHLVYRESEKALVARLSTEQSKQLEYQMRIAKVRGPTERMIQVD